MGLCDVFITDDDRGPMSLLGGAQLRAFAEHDARAMEAATRAMEEVSKRMEEASRAAALATAHSVGTGNGGAGPGITVGGHHPGGPGPASAKYVDVGAPPPCKRPALFDDEHRFLTHLGVPSARLKMTTQSQYITAVFVEFTIAESLAPCHTIAYRVYRVVLPDNSVSSSGPNAHPDSLAAL